MVEHDDPSGLCNSHDDSEPSEGDIVCDIPKFTGTMPTSWLYVIVPMLVYLSERLIRFIRGFQARRIAYYKLHPSDVLEIAVKNDDASTKINYRAGQYVYLKVKSISWFEWHAFTITSAPDDPNLTLHIRLGGDWCNELKKQIVSTNPTNKEPAFEFISVDGPYGTCAEDVYEYKEVMLIGAGIGVTPYASILKDLYNNAVEKTREMRKIRFYWICQNTSK